jgi:hypothetical protein
MIRFWRPYRHGSAGSVFHVGDLVGRETPARLRLLASRPWIPFAPIIGVMDPTLGSSASQFSKGGEYALSTGRSSGVATPSQLGHSFFR